MSIISLFYFVTAEVWVIKFKRLNELVRTTTGTSWLGAAIRFFFRTSAMSKASAMQYSSPLRTLRTTHWDL